MITAPNASNSTKEIFAKKTWLSPKMIVIDSSRIAAGANHGNYEGAYSDGHGGPAGSPVDATWAFYIHS